MQDQIETPIACHKRLFVLGATGATGRAVLEQAVMRRHKVTAFVRSPDKLDDVRDRIVVCKGDPTDLDEVQEALDGHDAVLSCLGHRGLGTSTLLRDAAKVTVAAMHNAGVHRFLVVSVALLFDDIGMLGSLARNTVLRNVVRDSADMEAVVESSGVDWTIVRPPRLTNGSATDDYALSDGHMPNDGMHSVSRADVACFMLDEAERPLHDHRVVGIASRRARTGASLGALKSARL